MKIINYAHDISDDLKLTGIINKLCSVPTSLFFDIETTGLSAVNSTLYLIGALWYGSGKINIRQWFNDDGYSEEEIINSFNEFCKDYTDLIHFNGSAFDIPYIKEKAGKYSLSLDNINRLNQLDIYKQIRSYKKLLGLENVRQITIEKYLGLIRDDTYTGGELINVYQRYIARPDIEKEHLLLLHNHDDLLGMPRISIILNYKALFENPELTVNNIQLNNDEHKITIEASLADLYIPKRLAYTDKNGIYINASEITATIIIPVKNDILKHFFKDYQNYYYLPQEDMAIHKSVSSYVESSNREKANRNNCYVKRNDSFILCPFTSYAEAYQIEPKDKILYQTCDSLLNASLAEKNEYAKSLITIIH